MDSSAPHGLQCPTWTQSHYTQLLSRRACQEVQAAHMCYGLCFEVLQGFLLIKGGPQLLLFTVMIIHSTPLIVQLRKSTVHLQMWIRQVTQQERITILAREKAQMAGNSLIPYLVPWSEISRTQHKCFAVGVQQQCRAAGLIGRFMRRFLRHRSMVEMPFAGIGDPG